MAIRVPRIQPDEVLASWLLRTAELNEIHKFHPLKYKIRETLRCGDKYESQGFIHITCRLLNIEPNSFSSEHTVFGDFYRGFGLHNKLLHGKLAAKHNTGLSENRVRFCAQCIREDIGYHGFYYFRRTHQLFGIRSCSKHDVKLENIEIATNHGFVRCKDILKNIKTKQEKQAPKVTRLESIYIDLIEIMAREIDNINTDKINSIIKRRTKRKLSEEDIEWLNETGLDKILTANNENEKENYLDGHQLILGTAICHEDSMTAYQTLKQCIDVRWGQPTKWLGPNVLELTV